nr:hypothetical protein [Tanacetum cinerariifolium]
MEDTMLELVEVCHQKEFYCIHNDVDDLIESDLNSKLLSINLESQRLNKKKQEVKNIMEQPTKCETRYEHLSTISKTESDEVTESSAKNLLPIPSEYEVTSDDKSDDDESLLEEDVSIEEFKVYSNPLFDDEEINSDEINPHCFNVESDFAESLSNRDTLIDSSSKFDFLEEFSVALMPTSIADEERIRREHAEYINLTETLFTISSCPRPMENSNKIVETLPTSLILIKDSDSQREEIDIFTGTDELLPLSIKSDDYDSERDINVLEELLVDDSISLLEMSRFTLIIKMIRHFPVLLRNHRMLKGDIRFLEELLIDDSILSDELSDANFEENPSIPQPPPEPPDDNFDLEPGVISAVMKDIDEPDEHFNSGGEILVSTNNEDVDYFPFMFVMRIFLPYLVLPEISLLLLSVESEDTIFDPGISE